MWLPWEPVVPFQITGTGAALPQQPANPSQVAVRPLQGYHLLLSKQRIPFQAELQILLLPAAHYSDKTSQLLALDVMKMISQKPYWTHIFLQGSLKLQHDCHDSYPSANTLLALTAHTQQAPCNTSAQYQKLKLLPSLITANFQPQPTPGPAATCIPHSLLSQVKQSQGILFNLLPISS